MHRDADAPAPRRRPHEEQRNHDKDDDAHRAVAADDAEVEQHDQRAEGEPVADNRERPRIAAVALEDETARRAALEMVRVSRKQRANAAMRTTPLPAARDRSKRELPSC